MIPAIKRWAGTCSGLLVRTQRRAMVTPAQRSQFLARVRCGRVWTTPWTLISRWCKYKQLCRGLVLFATRLKIAACPAQGSRTALATSQATQQQLCLLVSREGKGRD